MPKIAIVDDRKDLRETLENKIKLYLRKLQLNWEVIGIAPFLEKDDYLNWIRENDIAVLILDERLQEVQNNGLSVNYNGSHLIEYLRKTLPDFPVYAITGYETDSDLQDKFPLFDEILSRDTFFKRANEYILRFTRSGQRFLDTYNSHLIRISKISNLIAVGKATEDDIKELNSIQEYLNIPFTSYYYLDRETWLKDYLDNIDGLKEISNEIQDFISKNK